MDSSHLLVEVLGQPVHLVVVLVVLGPQLDLGDRLVSEAVAHHERGVPGGIAQVQQPPLGQHDDRAARVAKGPQVDLRLDVDPCRPGALQPGHVDLVVEVADISQDRVVLHRLNVLEHDDVFVAGRGYDDVGVPDGLLDGDHVEALHHGLQRVDRVDLGDGDPRSLALHRLRTALTDVAVAADEDLLTADQRVGAAVDAVDQGVPSAVLVVEFGLGHRVVDVDRREGQIPGRGELVEPQHAGGGLLGDALDRLGYLGPLVLVGLEAGP
ncbi:Uncharacterised protein [Mycobacterium tuberculosis]|nr:Uncharacterised protein [Mycobacterium tuberculosis]SGC43621.1 Uncharacterised protein [Mycobacterium tuberculosis]SGC62689.1 Uncharacterised protein [Mycobacterium tuberculosis]SGD07912.1 Uncharacterised protein [Mycobacterium tuberculosis]SGF73724.1 Uncharacterised protein [Mycobacterium tuberculosis]